MEPRRDKSEALGWDAERERRLVEMLREDRSLEEISREVSLPLDMLRERMTQLGLEDGFERPW